MQSFRPRSAAEIADAAIQLVRGNYRQLLPLAALLSVPSILIGVLTSHAAPLGTVARPDQLGKMFGLSMIAGLWWLVAMGALVAVASGAYVEERVEPADAARRAFSRAGSLIFGNLIAALGALVAFIVAVIVLGIVGVVIGLALGAKGATGGRLQPGMMMAVGVVGIIAAIVAMVAALFVFARYLLITPVIVNEGLGPLAAVNRSKTLSQGFIGRSLGLMLVALVLMWAASLSVFGLATLIIGNQPAASGIAAVVFIPLYSAWACLLSVLYYDLRIRKEGYDIELMARDVGAPEASLGADAAPSAAGR